MRLNFNTTITSPPSKNENYGIIFAGYFLTEDDFIEVFEQIYNFKKDELKSALAKKLLRNKDNKMVWNSRLKSETIYKEWEEIVNNFFGNDDVQLLAAVQFEDTEWNWTTLFNESLFLNKNGIAVIKTKIKDVAETEEKMYLNQELQRVINKHYNDFNAQVKTYGLSKEQSKTLHTLLNYRKEIKELAPEHFTYKTYQEILFAHQQEGKKLDAFMNHNAKMHAELFDAIKYDFNDVPKLPNHFPEIFKATPAWETQRWLIDSLNTASWLKGGDIVIVKQNGGDKGRVLFNIQLKTTKEGKTFELAEKALANVVENLYESIDKNIDSKQIAKSLFNSLKIKASNDIKMADMKLDSAIKDRLINKILLKQ